MATRNEILAVVNWLVARYPSFPLSDETGEAYCEDFAHIDAQELMDAARRHTEDPERQRWFPGPPDIKAAIAANREANAVVARIESNERRMLERADEAQASPETIEATRRALGLKLRGMS